MRGIVQEPNKILREIAKEVNKKEIGSQKIKKVIEEMKSSLSKEDDGVAIAAPQIGQSLRIFVISKKITKGKEDVVFVNPKIIRMSKQKHFTTEGCLSVRWKYGTIKRSVTATVKALNEKGNEFQMSGKGLLAQIFQHETDHLNGILFTDSAKNIEDIPPENEK